MRCEGILASLLLGSMFAPASWSSLREVSSRMIMPVVSRTSSDA